MTSLRRIVLAVLLALSIIGCSPHKWTKQDIYMEGFWQGLNLIDWGQTRKIAQNPDKFHEVNPILGRHPSVGKVDAYMGASAVAHVIITDWIPPKHRWFWHMVTITCSGLLVNQNFNIGLGWGW